MKCRICDTRKPRRYCPGVTGDICSICCGNEREVTVDCPLDCPFLVEARVQLAVLEVGLGGRLDATNVIAAPLATAVTSISLEHTAILGDTIDLIAREKAGILKPGAGVSLLLV